jgi:Subtilase family
VPPAEPRLRSQIELILGPDERNANQEQPAGHLEGSAAHPDGWRDAGDVEYLYRRNRILVSPRDVDRVIIALARILDPEELPRAELPDDIAVDLQAVSRGVVRLDYGLRDGAEPRALKIVPDVLRELDQALGSGVTTPDTVLFVCPNSCPATEPEQVPHGVTQPYPEREEGCCCDGRGDGVSVAVVDTGFVAQAALDHPWLAGVTGDEEQTLDGVNIRPYAYHGVFVAGGVRAMAPGTAVTVKGAFLTAGADYESNIAPKVAEALAGSPDVVVLTFAASTYDNRPLKTFEDLYETHLRHLKGVAVLCPAGNDGKSKVMWPAAFPWVTSVGALSSNWRTRAHFSNHGGWVDVYAPGEDLVNAYGAGTYKCVEPPDTGVVRTFEGMAKWSGTSYSTPLVAGLVAARMSVTGENGQQAAASLLELARSQAIPGVGAVLLPGQACCDPQPRERCRCRH